MSHTSLTLGLKETLVLCTTCCQQYRQVRHAVGQQYKKFFFYVLLYVHLYTYNLVNETNLVHELFLVYFVNFIYNLYMFRTSPGPSSGGTTVFMRHLIFFILYS